MLKARVTFRVMKLGRYVTVDDGGNYVTERSHKDKKIIIIITPHKESLGRLWANWAEISARLLKQILLKSNCRLHGDFFSPECKYSARTENPSLV